MGREGTQILHNEQKQIHTLLFLCKKYIGFMFKDFFFRVALPPIPAPMSKGKGKSHSRLAVVVVNVMVPHVWAGHVKDGAHLLSLQRLNLPQL